MSLLTDINWQFKYSPENGSLLKRFYLPALSPAIRYHRSTGYFRASALAAAARGVERLVRNQGRMRLLVGCTLEPPEAQAIAEGESLRNTVNKGLLRTPLRAKDPEMVDALELLAWMVAKGFLDVKLAIPCDGGRRPRGDSAIFHEKAGILEDKAGNRIAFNGSINESESGWRGNFDSFHVFTSWGAAAAHVDAEEESFARLWADQAKTAVVIDVPEAVRQDLLRFLPEADKLPRRLEVQETVFSFEDHPLPAPSPSEALPLTEPEGEGPEPQSASAISLQEARKAVWSYIHAAPALEGGGEQVGEATCPITPWPHQVRAFLRMYENWPPRLLIADEVGLGKTIQAGMILRQAWLSGRARRILVLAPKAVLGQWQIELREKFNLNWPIYDGRKLCWYPSPAWRENAVQAADPSRWQEQPCVLASSHLMRRKDRSKSLLESPEPWDLIVLDEAHHARRRGGGGGSSDDRPNQLLRLMQGLKDRCQGLILLTATPMQVSPVEVWDLLNLFGLPPEWNAEAFTRFFDYAARPMPSDGEMDTMAAMFRAVEAWYGSVSEAEAGKTLSRMSWLKVKKILRALRDPANLPRRKLETEERRAAVQLMKAHTPIKRLISRHTRELLRKYHQKGRIDARIAERRVVDQAVEMSEAERAVYEAVETYIATTYNNTDPDKRSAIGFVMTVYRRRLASSFYALARTLKKRLGDVGTCCDSPGTEPQSSEEDLPEDELSSDILDPEEAGRMEVQALVLEEKSELEGLLEQIQSLPTDTKAAALLESLTALRAEGYQQVMVFTQFTDTLDFLRDQVIARFGPESVLCFSGRGGEIADHGGTWRAISRDKTKQRFREQKAEIMLCTDAAAEGLNFQFCGALINYDMPWNPMKVEQRIGRIDRLGQEFSEIRIRNLLYEDTVETDVYRALRERIGLFTDFVGKLQPILSKLPRAISEVTLGRPQEREQARAALVSDLQSEADQLDRAGFDLDEAADEELIAPARPQALYGLPELHRILASSALLPPGTEIRSLGPKEFTYLAPGMSAPVRVTTDPEFFDANPESTELWSPAGPLFPPPLDSPETPDPKRFFRCLDQWAQPSQV